MPLIKSTRDRKPNGVHEIYKAPKYIERYPPPQSQPDTVVLRDRWTGQARVETGVIRLGDPITDLSRAVRWALHAGRSLRQCDLRNAQLAGSDFRGCDLTEVDFTNANLSGCRFAGAVLAGAEMRGVRLVDAEAIDLGQDEDGRHWVAFPSANPGLEPPSIAVGDSWVPLSDLKATPQLYGPEADHRLCLIRTLAEARGWLG